MKAPLLALLLGVSLLATLADASTPTPRVGPPISRLGSISGTVVDSNGDAIPGARVTVLAEDGSLVSESTAGAGGSLALGEFQVDQLPRGTYSVTAAVPEAKASARIPRVAVAAFEDTRVSITLDLGY